MIIINGTVTGQRLALDRTVVATGITIGQLKLSFSPEWDGYVKVAVFFKDKDKPYRTLFNDNGVANIPSEVANETGTCFIGVFGTLDNKVITTEAIGYNFRMGAITKDLLVPDPTPDIYTQLLSAYNTLGGAITDERLKAAVDLYIDEHPNSTKGATDEQAAQISQNTSDISQLKEDLTKYKGIYNESLFDKKYDLLYGSTWILGSISNGQTTSVNNRIRTEIIDISNMPNEFTVIVEDGYMWNFYDFDNMYAGLEWKNGGYFNWNQHGNPKHVAFLVKKSDDSEITDISEVYAKIKIEFSLFGDFYKDRNVIIENTELSTCLSNGCYGCNSSIIDTIPDKPDFITKGFILFVNNVNYTDGNNFIKTQHIFDRAGNCGYRMITTSGVCDDWICLHNQYKEKLISIGDSIPLGTWSWLNDEGYQHTAVDEGISYVQVMCDILGLENLNYCHGGLGWLRNANDGTLLKPLLETIDFSVAKTVFIQLGTNDWNYGFELGEISDTKDTETVCGGIRYAIEYIMEQNPIIKLVIVSPFNRAPYGSSYGYNWGYGAYNTLNKTLKDYCGVIKTICEEYGVQYIDCTLNSAIGRLNIMSMCPDGTHPSIEAHNILGHEFAGRYPFN